MTLTAVGTNSISGERGDSVVTLPITDSTTITANDFVELSSGKLIKSITALSTSLVGIANSTKTMGVYSTSGQQDYMGVVTEGIVIVKGLVEGSGGTYKTALAVGDKVSFHYDSTSGYGQFVINSTSSAVGTVVEGTVASSGSTADQWDYIAVQLDFESGESGGDIPDGVVTNAKVNASAAIVASKLAVDTPGQINATKQYMDVGTFALTATESTAVVDFSAALSTTAGVKIFSQALTKTATITIPGSITKTSFTLTGTASQTGNWFAWIPSTSI